MKTAKPMRWWRGRGWTYCCPTFANGVKNTEYIFKAYVCAKTVDQAGRLLNQAGLIGDGAKEIRNYFFNIAEDDILALPADPSVWVRRSDGGKPERLV